MTGASSAASAGDTGRRRPRRRRIGLGWRLILLVVAAVVPLLAFQVGYQYSQYREQVAATEQQTLVLARSISLVVERELQVRIGVLRALGTSRLLRAGDLAAFRQQAEEVVERQFPNSNANIVLLKENGEQLMNTLVPSGAPLPVRPNVESVRRAYATGAPAVSDLYQGAVGARLVIAVDVPIKADDGSVRYVLSLVQPSRAVSDIIRDQHFPESWVATVFDRNGVIVARVPNGDKFIGHRASPSFLGPLLAQREAVANSTSLEGIALISAFSHADRFGWAVGVGIPRAELVAPVAAGAIKTLSVGGALLVFGLMLALYAARRIAGPIDTLRRLAVATDGSAPVEPMPTGLSEVDEVAAALYRAEVERRRSHEAEQVLRDGIESIPEGFSIYNDDDCLVMCNSTYRSLFPNSAEHVVPGTRYEDILRAGIAKGHYAEAAGQDEGWIAARLREHRNAEAAVEQRLSDGRWVLVTKHRLSNGWIAGLRVDITAVKAAEVALRKSERRFQDIAEVSGDWMWESDAQHRFTQFTGESTDTLPVRPTAVMGKTRWELCGGDPDADELWAAHKRDLDAHRPFRHFRYTIATPEGRRMFITASGKPVFDEDGNFLGYRGTAADETALRATESALRNSEERFRSVVEAVPNAIVMVDEAGQIEIVNAQAERIFGHSRDTMLGRPVEMLIPARYRAAHPELRTGFFAAPGARLMGVGRDLFAARKDGSEFPVEVGLAPIETDGGVRVLASIIDISERRRTEGLLRQAQKMDAIGNLTGGLAHDFNNLLGVVVGNLDLARELAGDQKDLSELVGEALDAAWRGADLTRRLLAFARRQPLHPAPLDVNDLVSNTVRLLRRLLGEDIEVVLRLGADIWPVIADPAQLEASLANLATNARDAMPRGGQLIIETANRFLDADYAASHADVTPGEFVMLQVSDNGSGMPPETMSQIFEPFFTTKEQGKGTGLGLSMVFGFMKQSGGHINVYSEVGAGTTFRLYLPRGASEEVGRQAPGTAEPTRGGGETVLVVEDNSGMRQVVLRQLRDLGYRVLECDRAGAALDLLQHEAVDLLLTDIVMPGGLDGVELARIARERWPRLKIVLTSGFPQARVEGNGEVPGTLRLLSKPYRREELAAALRAALDE